MRQAPRAFARARALALAAALLSTVLAFANRAAAQATIALPAEPRPELKPGPGSGYRTAFPPMVRTLRSDVTVTAILSSGDTLVAPTADEAPFTFAQLPDGLGATSLGPGMVQVFVAHGIDWQEGRGGARVSRLDLDARSLGVLSADYVIDGTEGYSRLAAVTLADARLGFVQPRFLINEQSVESPRGGIVAAMDTRSAAVNDLPWLGRFSHESTTIVPVTTNRIVAILTEDADPGESQLYMYIAETDADFLRGSGQLYVFRADGVSGGPGARLASSITRSRPGSGRFVPLPSGERLSAAALEVAAQRSGCLNFVRLKDAAVDRRRFDAFYFVDTGDPDLIDRNSGRTVTNNGRMYHMTLDPFDPTLVTELSVLLDGDEGDDLYRPDNIDTDDTVVMIQENPGAHGLHTARILSYDVRSRRLEAIAECAERDRKGRLLPPGVGGEWASTGILNVSEQFGEDAWLLAVQAHTLRVRQFGRPGQGGQLLLLRGPRFPKKSAQ